MNSFGIDLLEFLLLVLGATLAFSGWRAIRQRRTMAEIHECQGRAAALPGWPWRVLGLLLILAAVTDIALLKSLGKIFMESAS